MDVNWNGRNVIITGNYKMKPCAKSTIFADVRIYWRVSLCLQNSVLGAALECVIMFIIRNHYSQIAQRVSSACCPRVWPICSCELRIDEYCLPLMIYAYDAIASCTNKKSKLVLLHQYYIFNALMHRCHTVILPLNRLLVYYFKLLSH